MKQKPERFFFIINPIAGVRSKEDIPRKIKEVFSGSEKYYEIAFTKFKGHATELAQEAVNNNFDAVVAVGGDGTINEVATGLIGQTPALGIIPLGSGNGLARHLKVPIHIQNSIKYLLDSAPVSIDHCRLNNLPFFCTAGVGFDALIGKVFSEQKTRGFSTYLKTVITEYKSYKCETYKISLDGKEIEMEAFLLSFANASQYGNNVFIAPQASLQDGYIDVCMMHPFPSSSLLNLGFKLFTKKVNKFHYLDIIKAKNIEIERESSGPVHLDGEPVYMDSRLKISIVPNSLRVLSI
ncbi:YegS//BmrU family lipid kinase [Sporocytophaga myxococcoides]|uniref:YegS BmrU family lipid kinase n=1 Tax=Sporocytophaga myxococcoides TaxID=153721 RepID=A0A098LJB8_9BACT|nr:diacylglycerol kinase family protein [Sporocytophaga myxococcoides]GAL87045.1 YegS//BmrU family lipid kinase [Sporocytophaga myxococcoides]